MSDEHTNENVEEKPATADQVAAAVMAVEGNHVVTTRGLRMIAVTLSFVGLLLVGAMVYLYEQNRTAINSINSLVHPTPAQYRQQLRRGIKLCLREPECRKLFPQITTDPKKRKAALKAIRQEQAREIRVAARRARDRQLRAQRVAQRNAVEQHPQVIARINPPKRRPGSGGHGPGGGGGGSSGGGGSGSASPPPPENHKPLAHTPSVTVPATPATPPVTVPSVDVPCPDLAPITSC